MAKITIEVLLKIAEIISNIAVIITDTLNGGKKKNDNTRSSKKK